MSLNSSRPRFLNLIRSVYMAFKTDCQFSNCRTRLYFYRMVSTELSHAVQNITEYFPLKQEKIFVVDDQGKNDCLTSSHNQLWYSVRQWMMTLFMLFKSPSVEDKPHENIRRSSFQVNNACFDIHFLVSIGNSSERLLTGYLEKIKTYWEYLDACSCL